MFSGRMLRTSLVQYRPAHRVFSIFVGPVCLHTRATHLEAPCQVAAHPCNS